MPWVDAVLLNDARIAVLVKVSRAGHIKVALDKGRCPDKLTEEYAYLIRRLCGKNDVGILCLSIVKTI